MSNPRTNPALPALCEQLRRGLITRRAFVRLATLFGIAAGAAYAMAGLVAPAMAGSTLPFPAVDPAAKRGGKLRVGQMVGRMHDPATYNWTEMANQTRPILEYLTMLGPDNVVRPMLAESWAPSADLKTWTLKVRSGVMWHNGEPLTAEHVAWNLRRWADPTLGSSNLGLSTFAALTELTGEKDAKGRAMRKPVPSAVEVLDERTVRLNLTQPVLSVAEDCAEYFHLDRAPLVQGPAVPPADRDRAVHPCGAARGRSLHPQAHHSKPRMAGSFIIGEGMCIWTRSTSSTTSRKIRPPRWPRATSMRFTNSP